MSSIAWGDPGQDDVDRQLFWFRQSGGATDYVLKERLSRIVSS